MKGMDGEKRFYDTHFIGQDLGTVRASGYEKWIWKELRKFDSCSGIIGIFPRNFPRPEHDVEISLRTMLVHAAFEMWKRRNWFVAKVKQRLDQWSVEQRSGLMHVGRRKAHVDDLLVNDLKSASCVRRSRKQKV